MAGSERTAIKRSDPEEREFLEKDDNGNLYVAGEVTGTVSIPPATDFATFGQDVAAVAVKIDISVLADTAYVLVQADIANTEPVYVGKATVTIAGATRGTQLVAGQNTTYPVSLNSIYVIATDGNQKIIATLFNGA